MERSYSALAAYLAAGRTAKSRTTRKVANNTYLELRGPSTIAVRLHSTDIVTYRADGTITLQTGGWPTVTTKARMNAWLPPGYAVWSDRGTWSLHFASNGNRASVRFFDGMTFAVGTLPPPPNTAGDDAWNAEVDRLVRAYVRGLTDQRVAELWRLSSAPPACDQCADGLHDRGEQCGHCNGAPRPVPVALAVDYVRAGVPEVANVCDPCLTGTADGNDPAMPHAHLWEHVNDGTYPPALIVNAVRATGYGPGAITIGSIVRTAVRGYLLAHLSRGTRARRTWPRSDPRWLT